MPLLTSFFWRFLMLSKPVWNALFAYWLLCHPYRGVIGTCHEDAKGRCVSCRRPYRRT